MHVRIRNAAFLRVCEDTSIPTGMRIYEYSYGYARTRNIAFLSVKTRVCAYASTKRSIPMDMHGYEHSNGCGM